MMHTNGPTVSEQLQSAARELTVWMLRSLPPAIALTVILTLIVGGTGTATVTPAVVAFIFSVSFMFASYIELQQLAQLTKNQAND